jgi:nucleotide-binding universal stress UspA family protein
MSMHISSVRPRIDAEGAAVDGVFSRFVIGVDFTPASLTAAKWATAWVAKRPDALLAHVGSPREDDGAPSAELLPGGQLVGATSSALVAGLDGFGSTLETSRRSAVLRIGRPSYWLSIIAGWSEATLMVLGRRADSARRRVGEPNVRERVARRTGASVLVVPEGTMRPPNYILAAIDEGVVGKAVLTKASGLAALHKIPLRVLHVLAPVSGAYERVIDGWRRTRRGMRHPVMPTADNSSATAATPRWLSEVSGSPVSGTMDRVQIGIGDPAREIVSTGMTLGTPLIVVGKRGADGAPEGSLGSVTRILLASCPFPVLAVGVN